MSGNKINTPPNQMQLAFDYVTGVLRGPERRDFEQLLRSDEALQTEVRYWEEQLMNLGDYAPVTPDAQVWTAIAQRLATPEAPPTPSPWYQRWLQARFWLMSAAASVLLACCLWLVQARDPLLQPNADYVAVLTNTQGAPLLTVLTAKGGSKLWLKWNNIQVEADKNLQLWAVSRSDGQIRSLGVFADTGTERLALEKVHWRLIKDAEYLLLTKEDPGGSPLDEPSDELLAKGACVLLAQVNNS